eukprot:10050173-Alexandrium_andersonii.AAC.1
MERRRTRASKEAPTSNPISRKLAQAFSHASTSMPNSLKSGTMWGMTSSEEASRNRGERDSTLARPPR